jgi:hypothetical protein
MAVSTSHLFQAALRYDGVFPTISPLSINFWQKLRFGKNCAGKKE